MICYASVPLPRNFSFPILEYGGGGTLFPGDDLYLHAKMSPPVGTRALTKAQWLTTHKPHKANQTWYVYGWVTYQDIYHAYRYTRFCFEIWWNDGRGKIPGWYFAPCFNETEESYVVGLRRLWRFLTP